MKREEDNIFDALMLRSPTVNGLKEAIAEKFELDYNKISKVLTMGNCRIDSEKREKTCPIFGIYFTISQSFAAKILIRSI